jgi:hypothetical protein
MSPVFTFGHDADQAFSEETPAREGHHEIAVNVESLPRPKASRLTAARGFAGCLLKDWKTSANRI